jgi:hypothetical protein
MPEEEIHQGRRGFLGAVLGAAARRVVPFSLPSPVAAVGEVVAGTSAPTAFQVSPAVYNLFVKVTNFKVPAHFCGSYFEFLGKEFLKMQRDTNYKPIHSYPVVWSNKLLDSGDRNSSARIDYAATKKAIIDDMRAFHAEKIGSNIKFVLLPQIYFDRVFDVLSLTPGFSEKDRIELEKQVAAGEKLDRFDILKEHIRPLFSLSHLYQSEEAFKEIQTGFPSSFDFYFEARPGELSFNPFDRESQSESEAILVKRLQAFVELAYTQESQGQRLGFFEVPPEVEAKLKDLQEKYKGSSFVPQIQGEEREKVRVEITEAIAKAVSGLYERWRSYREYIEGRYNPEKKYFEVVRELGQKPSEVPFGDVVSGVRMASAVGAVAQTFTQEAEGGAANEPTVPVKPVTPLAIGHSAPETLDIEIVPTEAQMAAATPKTLDQA